MKRVLITGANSYIGTNVEKWLMREPDKYYVETLDMRNPNWKSFDFSNFDVVFHVAGIAHVSRKKSLKDYYFKINRDLAIETAEKAKIDGVKQFIFMSSIIVYGKSGTNGIITKDTVPKPSNFYGESKLQAEEGITKLMDEFFKVVILRPPMIYGKGCKGNYPKLVKLAKILPIFPNFDNKRSMLYIANLCEFIKLMIDNEENGLFFPQNKEYVKISVLVKLIANYHGNNIRLTKIFNAILKFFIKKNTLLNKIFGNLVYDKSLSDYKQDYNNISLRESIELIEKI